MKIKSRKIFAILVVTLMVLSLLPLNAFAATAAVPPAYGVTSVSVDSNEVEAGDGVEVTLTFYNNQGNPYNLAAGETFDFFLRSSRGAETITQKVYDNSSWKTWEDQKGTILQVDNVAIGDGATLTSSEGGSRITVSDLEQGQLKFLVYSSFSGSATLYFYDNNSLITGDSGDGIEFARETLTYSAAKVKDVNSTFTASATALSLFDNLTLTATVRDSAGKLVKDEEVTFQKRFEGGAWKTIETEETNALGVADINTTESEAGKWEYRARVGTTTLGSTKVGDPNYPQIRKVDWAGTKATEIEGSIAEKIAVDEEVKITFNVTDAFGNGVNAQAVKFEVDSKPAGASSKTETILPGSTTNTDWKDGEVEFKYTPNRTGEYTIKATVLDGVASNSGETGLTEEVTFTAVEFGTVESVVVKLAKDRISVKSDWDTVTVGTSGALTIDSTDNTKGAVPEGSWMKMKVELYDENGVKSTDVEGEIRLATSNPGLAKINPYGTDICHVVASSDEDKRGVVTITATHIDTGHSASVELPIVGEPNAIETDVSVTGNVANVTMQFVDVDGNKTWAEDATDTAFSVIAPSGVSVSHREDFSKGEGFGEFRATAEEAGTYTLTVVSDNGLSKTFDVAIGEAAGEPGTAPEYGAASMTMFIGSDSFVADGAGGAMDVAPFIEDSRTFVPVRFIAEALGAEADWEPKDAATEVVTLTREDKIITIKIGEYTLEVKENSEEGEVTTITMDVAAMIKSDRTFLPFRFIAEAFGAEVDWGPKDGPTEWVTFLQ